MWWAMLRTNHRLHVFRVCSCRESGDANNAARRHAGDDQNALMKRAALMSVRASKSAGCLLPQAKERRRLFLGLAVGIVLATLLAAGPFLVVQDELRPAGAIVVIGGDHKPQRMQKAAELYRQGYAPIVIISAGTIVLEGDQHIPEAQVMYRQARELGLPDDVLILEQASKSTSENAIDTKAICQAKGIHSILLVTSAYHSRRARRLFQSVYMPDVSVSVQSAPQGDCPLCWPLFPDRASVVAYEYWNWVQYWLSK
jgi:uncharacterized SAM-binding protein YcdF (DUF218 family)